MNIIPSNVPLDVERLFIEAAIEQSLSPSQRNPSTVLAVAFTCRRFRDWAYPCIYRSIYIETPTQILNLLRTLTHSPYLSSLVKILTFSEKVSYHNKVSNITSLCPNLTSLVYWSHRPPSSNVADISKNPSLRKLSFDPYNLDQSQISPPSRTLMNLTHLDFCANIGESYLWYPMINTLTNLSHLFISVLGFDPRSLDITRLPPNLPPNLTVCILYCFYPLPEAQLAEAEPIALGQFDSRIVVGLERRPESISFPCITRTIHEILMDWAEYNDGPDLWEQAEMIIRSRLNSSSSSLAS